MKPIQKKASFPTFFDDFFTDRLLRHNLFPVTKDFTGFRTPAINVKESTTAYELAIAAPGMQKEDFRVDIENNLLTISTEKREEQLEEGAKYSRKEFGYFYFKRSFSLPKDRINTENIEAQYNNGILKLNLPKKEEAIAIKKKIEIV